MRSGKSAVVSLLAGASVVVCAGSMANAVSTAALVKSYTPGDFAPTSSNTVFQNSSAALGALNGDTTFGGLNPFNPPFAANQIVIIGAGGHLTLQLGEPDPTNGHTLGVFSDNGLIDVSGGSGVAGNPATTFDNPDHPEAIVKVSQDGNAFVTLNGGNPIVFSNPTNYFLDSSISNFFEPIGNVVSDQSKPFLGTLTDFNGETFAQMKQTLNGSAGGTWLDLSGTGLSSINYVEFDVPAGADYRMVVDSVAAVPEPSGALVVALGIIAMTQRRRRD
jgi:hypothetical protein